MPYPGWLDERERVLARLNAVTGERSIDLLRGLVDAVCVLGGDQVGDALAILSRRRPALHDAFKTERHSVYTDPDVAALTSQADRRRCTTCSMWLSEDWQRHDWQGKLLCPSCFYKALSWRETCQGTAVAPTKRLALRQPWYIEDIDPARIDYSKPVTVNVSAPAADVMRDMLARFTQACEFCNEVAGALVRHDMGEGRSMLLCTACRATIRAGMDGSEPDVDEAVTPDVAALMAAGDVVGAQALILDGLASYHRDQEAVYVPPQALVMPAPRAGTLPDNPMLRVGVTLPPRAPTGKPCRVCMRDAYHIRSSPSGKPWHYCDEHIDEGSV